MNALLIDAGNSRLKWASLRGGRLGALHSAAWDDSGLPALAARIAAHAGRPDSVLVASVAGTAVQRALRRALRAARLPAPQFVVSGRQQGGVSNGYRWPEQLGVDRWLALLAARAMYPTESVCIVSVGTALTLDLLEYRGRHLGGAIVPGPALMVDSLLNSTAEIRRRAARGTRPARGPSPRGFFARDTRSAVCAGSLHAAVALTEYAMSRALETVSHPPRLLLTGGGARELQRQLGGRELGIHARRVDNLVLRGLAVLAQQESS